METEPLNYIYPKASGIIHHLCDIYLQELEVVQPDFLITLPATTTMQLMEPFFAIVSRAYQERIVKLVRRYFFDRNLDEWLGQIENQGENEEAEQLQENENQGVNEEAEQLQENENQGTNEAEQLQENDNQGVNEEAEQLQENEKSEQDNEKAAQEQEEKAKQLGEAAISMVEHCTKKFLELASAKEGIIEDNRNILYAIKRKYQVALSKLNTNLVITDENEAPSQSEKLLSQNKESSINQTKEIPSNNIIEEKDKNEDSSALKAAQQTTTTSIVKKKRKRPRKKRTAATTIETLSSTDMVETGNQTKSDLSQHKQKKKMRTESQTPTVTHNQDQTNKTANKETQKRRPRAVDFF